jgi:CubicO group peptidase (beta-lactamase class C family)
MNKVGMAKAGGVACLMVLVLVGLVHGETAGGVTPATDPLLAQATYAELEPGRFMTKWLLLGPLPVGQEQAAKDDQEQKKAFAVDPLSTERLEGKVKIADREYEWTAATASGDTVDLAAVLGPKSYVTAYAWACIEADQESRAMLGIGSDDAVKVWLNGELVHENWIQRACAKDSDLVPVTFRKGANQLVLKVQNGTGDWAFSCRVVGPEGLAERLLTAAQGGQIDTIDLLVGSGVDVNRKMGPGLTALHLAQIAGRAEVVKHLVTKGAQANVPLPAKEKIVDWLCDGLVKEAQPGVAVLVAREGKVLYQNGYGYADIGNRVKVTPETKFRIGSVTKQFTAAAILKLQEQGKLSVQDKLSQYFADFPRGDEVTLHHLLTHTSGIHSYTSKPDFLKTVLTETTPAELVDSFKNDKFDFDPGASQAYCNSGYFLLGCIVEKVSGQSLDAFLREAFFVPLGMKETGVHYRNRMLDHEATGYSYENGKVQRALDWDMSRAGGAGALYSTVGDLCRWNQGIFEDKLLQESSLEAAFTPAKLNDGRVGAGASGPGGYGYGWSFGQLRGLKWIAHGGGLHGFGTYLMQVPDQKLTVAVLCNCLPSQPELSTSDLANRIAELYLFEAMEPQSSFAVDKTVDSSTYDDYVGRYDYGNGAVLTVTKENGRLLAQLTGQGALEMLPRAKDEFFWKDVDAQITFVRDSQGKVTGGVHCQGGQTLQVPKLKDEAVAQIDPALYDAYTGEYELENIGTMKVIREGEHLYVQLGSQPRAEIFPRTTVEFFLKIVQANIAFVKDKDGRVTSLTLQQAGLTLTGQKVK